VHLSVSLRRAATVAAMAMTAIAAVSCGREPTDPSRTSLTGLWKSFDVDLYIHDIEMEIHENEPGVVIGKWSAIGKVDNSCPVGTFCKDTSIIQGRNEVSQVVLHLFGAGDFVGERTTTTQLKGIIRSREQNFHVTFTRF
jgi:hypothetical protein